METPSFARRDWVHTIFRAISRLIVVAIRLIFIAIMVAIMIGAAALAYAYFRMSQSLPDYTGDRSVAGVASEVEIVRDSFATPHIFAQTENDAIFALGYVHAQDRLWQMVLRRRLASGRLSEFAAPFARWIDFFNATPDGVDRLETALLQADILARSLDIYGASHASLAYLSPQTKRKLDAYAAGVNARLAEIKANGLGRGAPELWLFDISPDFWRPVDSIATLKLMAATLSADVFRELERAIFANALGAERLADLYPDLAGAPIMSPPPFGAGDQALNRAVWRVAQALNAPFSPNAPQFAGASNAWAAAPSRTASRAPLLASDPHLALTAPSIWHVARLSFPQATSQAGDIYGATVPGVPAMLLGRNTHFAWGLATFHADVGDVYIEKVNPENPVEYRAPDGWRPFETREVRIPVGSGEAVSVALRRTRHGPVLPLSWPGVAETTPKGYVAAVAWTALAHDDTSLDAIIGLGQAKSIDAAKTLASKVISAPQMVVVADREGIGMMAVGRIPLRKTQHETKGRFPSRGWVKANDWEGFLPPSQNPAQFSPSSGLVATANNKPVEHPFPRHYSFDWPADYRIRRLSELLNQREFHTLNGFQAIQLDTHSKMAATLTPVLLRALRPEPNTPLAQSALRLMRNWRYEMDPLRPEPLIFSAWLQAVLTLLTQDDLADIPVQVRRISEGLALKALTDDAVGQRWCDDARTIDKEDCGMIVSQAFDQALTEISNDFGGRIETWRWGRAHQAVHRHTVLGAVPVLGRYFNITHETGGGDHTLMRGISVKTDAMKFTNRHAAGFRAIYDFADLDRSVFALATGQSGHFLSRHYDDLAALWRVGDYAPMSLARRDADAGAVGVMRLTPEIASVVGD